MRYIQRTYVNAVLDGESKNQFGLVSVLLMIPKAFQDDKIQDFLYRLQTVTCVCVTMKCGFSSLFHPLPLSPSPFFLNSSNINICHLTTATVLQKNKKNVDYESLLYDRNVSRMECFYFSKQCNNIFIFHFHSSFILRTHFLPIHSITSKIISWKLSAKIPGNYLAAHTSITLCLFISPNFRNRQMKILISRPPKRTEKARNIMKQWTKVTSRTENSIKS